MKDWKPLWKHFADTKTITKRDVYICCLLKAIGAKSQFKEAVAVGLLQKAFTPITNKKKLENGQKAYSAITTITAIPYNWEDRVQPEDPNQLLDCLDTEQELALFKKLDREATQKLYDKIDDVYKDLEERKNEKYTFVFVRQDLSIAQQMVQGMHVFGKLTNQLEEKEIDKLNLVLCGADNLKRLSQIKEVLTGHKYNPIEIVEFIEPDNNNELTAIATTPLDMARKRRLKEFKLLTI